MITREQLPEGSIRLTFTLPAEEPAGQVSVVGSFNDWSPGQTTLATDGEGATRQASIVVEPGTYHFRYLATGGMWFDDDHADTVDEHGGVVHCHQVQESIEPHQEDSLASTDPVEMVDFTEDVDSELDIESAAASAPANASDAKGRRQKAAAAR